MIIQDSGHPWSDRLLIGIQDDNIEFGVIGLPGRVGLLGPMTPDHLVVVSVSR